MKFSIVVRNILVTFFSFSLLVGCTSTDPYTGESRTNRTSEGAIIGAAIGALSGALLAKGSKGETRKGLLIGAGVGALAGGAIGNYQDQQESVLRDRLRDTGVSVTRRGNSIILNMPQDITFSVDSSTIHSEFYSVLSSVALVLREFDQTVVNVFGHTDSDGSDSYNFNLSERRALSVSEYLIQQGNDQRRFYVRGYGESRPIASNSDSSGKARNRRVEVEIEPLT